MNRITYYERQIIESGLRTKKTLRDIARSLNRDHTVISREVESHSGDYLPYTAVSAQRIADQSQRDRSKKKLEKDFELKDYVVRALKDDQSPEQIAGTLKEQPPFYLEGKNLCHETIYQYIYNGEGRFQYLYAHLRRKHFKRRKQKARKPRKTSILERVSIHERPEEVNQKLTFGHWESDTVVCRKQVSALSVQYERKSQLVRIHKVANRTARETEYALHDTISSLSQSLFKSMTFDNGGEGACHTKIRDGYNIKTFFCDGYASWQKPGVENINGLIRQYIPKDAMLDEMTIDDIYAIQEKLNNRPRKNLNYLTPNQVIAQVVQ